MRCCVDAGSDPKVQSGAMKHRVFAVTRDPLATAAPADTEQESRRRRRRHGLALAAITALATVLATTGLVARGAPSQAADLAEVITDRGTVRGIVTENHRTFLGIPYATPPVGNLRWRAPRPAQPWSGVRDATHASSVCPQLRHGPDGTSVVGSEDCLYLNVTTPTVHQPARLLPVMVWISGGGFVSGAASDYDSTRLVVEGGVIAVSMNYRLGALGFLAHPALSDDPDLGNYGLADQQAALRWVRRNITAFGGDPRNVTIFGQSAGGFSICAHLAAPGSRGLFDKAITQSAPCGNAFVTSAVAQARGVQVASALGCPPSPAAATMVCLRAKPVADLAGIASDRAFTALGPLQDMPWTPVVGTPALGRQPLQALRDGATANIPFMQGSTRDEMRPFVALDYDARGKPVTVETYPAILHDAFGARADNVLATYPARGYPSPGLALATALTDSGRKLGSCPVLPANDAAAKHGPVYAYEFAEDMRQTLFGFPLGAPHGAELAYLFDGTFAGPSGPPPLTADQQALAHRMIRYWTQFAKTGNPNSDGLPRWPAYRPSGHVLSLASAPGATAPVDFARAHHCDFWLSE
jgi:para-nitrobenzyl esterase